MTRGELVRKMRDHLLRALADGDTTAAPYLLDLVREHGLEVADPPAVRPAGHDRPEDRTPAPAPVPHLGAMPPPMPIVLDEDWKGWP